MEGGRVTKDKGAKVMKRKEKRQGCEGKKNEGRKSIRTTNTKDNGDEGLKREEENQTTSQRPQNPDREKGTEYFVFSLVLESSIETLSDLFTQEIGRKKIAYDK